MMDISRTSVTHGIEGNGHIIVVTLKGVPVTIRVVRPERLDIALHEAGMPACNVATATMHWSEAAGPPSWRSAYYSAPLPTGEPGSTKTYDLDWSAQRKSASVLAEP